MGANRPTVANKARKKRRLKFERRLAEKAAAAANKPEGMLDKVKHAAVSAAHTVGDAVKSAAHAIKDAVTPAK